MVHFVLLFDVPGPIYLHNSKAWQHASQQSGFQKVQYCLVIWKKYFNTTFSFKYGCMESRFIKPPQDVTESVEVIGKQRMNHWQSENYKGALLRWNEDKIKEWEK